MKAITLVLIILIGLGQFAISQSLRSSLKISKETYKKLNINPKFDSFDNEFIPSKTTVYTSKITDVDLLKKKLDSMTMVYENINYVIQYHYNAKGYIISQKVFEENILDSTFVQNSEISYAYDSYNNIVEEITKTLISGQFEKLYKYNYTYDINGNRTQFITYQWISNQWQAVAKGDYTFNVNQDLLNYTIYSYSITQNMWVSAEDYEWVFDSNNNLILHNHSYFDSISNQLEIAFNYEYTNDSLGRVVQTISSNNLYHNNQLELYEKTINTYSGLVDSIIYYNWDLQGSVWNNNGYIKYTYNSSGNIMFWEVYNWDLDSNQWAAERKGIFTYDVNENNIKQVYYKKNIAYGPWINDFKWSYIYNFSNIVVQKISSYWNSNTNAWDDNQLETKTFNTLYPFASLCLPDPNYGFNENNFPFMPIQEVDYVKLDSTNQFVVQKKTNYYFSDINVVSIETPIAKQLKVYPNPSTNFIFFEIENRASTYWVDIMDIQSKIITKEELSSDGKISVSHLPKGIYIYRLYNQEDVIVGKFIVE